MQMEICKIFTFESSHILPKHPGRCSRLHGHSWKLTVYVKGEVDKETGFVMDYADIKRIMSPIVDGLDHRHLGQWPATYDGKWLTMACKEWGVGFLPGDFYPSSENLIVAIANEIDPDRLTWSKLELDETCTSKCILTREDYEIEARRGREGSKNS